MKVLHINSYFRTNALHQELLSALDRKDLTQLVFLPVLDTGGVIKERTINAGEKALVVEIKAFSNWMRLLWPAKMLKIWRIAKPKFSEFAPDLVHAHTVITNGAIAFLAKRKFGIPYVVTVRNTDIDIFFKYFPPLRWVGKKILESASAIVLLSPVYRNAKLPKYFSIAEHSAIYEKIRVVPNAVADFWHESLTEKEEQNDRSIIFVGRLDKNKNLGLVIEALKILHSKDMAVSLKVVGDGPELEALRRKARGLDVTFYGRIDDRHRIVEIMRTSDMLVVPSKLETFGLVYVEAMTQGLPVLYTTGQGFDGFFEEGEVGYSVDPERAESVASAIEKVYENYGLLSKNAQIRSDVFRWERVSNSLLTIYRAVIGRKDVGL